MNPFSWSAAKSSAAVIRAMHWLIHKEENKLLRNVTDLLETRHRTGRRPAISQSDRLWECLWMQTWITSKMNDIPGPIVLSTAHETKKNVERLTFFLDESTISLLETRVPRKWLWVKFILSAMKQLYYSFKRVVVMAY